MNRDLVLKALIELVKVFNLYSLNAAERQRVIQLYINLYSDFEDELSIYKVHAPSKNS